MTFKLFYVKIIDFLVWVPQATMNSLKPMIDR